MKRFFLLIFCAAALLGCRAKNDCAPVPLIFDTDLGNDIDDAIAMDLLYKYADAGKIRILAEGISKDGLAPAEYMDILNNWYGYPEIPMGIVVGGADCETDAVNYAKAVNAMADPDGNPLFGRTPGMDYGSLPQSHMLYRKILAGCDDASVTFVTVGFSTNLARLLDTPADGFSPLSGRELVARKVRLLVMMAGSFDGSLSSEYNVLKDIPSAQKVVSEWPGEIVFAPFELGIQVCYPASSIENDFSGCGEHPVVEAYKAYLPMPYDRPCWDPAALVYAVEGDVWFGVSPYGRISISDSGETVLDTSDGGNHRYITVDNEQAGALTCHIVSMMTGR